MLFRSIDALRSAFRLLLKNWTSTLILLIAYVGLISVVYLFVSTKEATVSQLALTLMLAAVAIGIFFLLQSAALCYTTVENANDFLRRSLSTCWKIVVVTLPVIGFTIAVAYVLTKIQNHAAPPPPVAALPLAVVSSSTKSLTLLLTIRYLLFGVFLPLGLIHLWVAVIQDGFRASLSQLRDLSRRIFAPESLLIYSFGFIVFALLPYLVLTKSVSTQKPWLELAVFSLRLALTAILILLGWLLTVGSLTIRQTGDSESANL
ncbi:MAG: hypothetical protein ABR555_12880 [Pyrinomonadaceae bacterium]